MFRRNAGKNPRACSSSAGSAQQSPAGMRKQSAAAAGRLTARPVHQPQGRIWSESRPHSCQAMARTDPGSDVVADVGGGAPCGSRKNGRLARPSQGIRVCSSVSVHSRRGAGPVQRHSLSWPGTFGGSVPYRPWRGGPGARRVGSVKRGRRMPSDAIRGRLGFRLGASTGFRCSNRRGKVALDDGAGGGNRGKAREDRAG